MEWLPLIISIVGAAVSILGAYRASQAANRAEAAARKREEGRQAIADVLDIANPLAEALQESQAMGNPSGLSSQLHERYLAFEDQADAAVRKADKTQLPRYHEPLKGKTHLQAIRERIARLHDIQDRL